MDKNKQIELIRKRNAKLTRQLNDIKFKLEFDTKLNQKSTQYAKDLICHLENVQNEWQEQLSSLKQKQTQYAGLISDLKDIKSIMTDMGFKIPWYKKILKNR